MRADLRSYSATIFVGWQDRTGVLDHQAFRKQLFVDRLNWPLTHENGLESDEFDTSRAIYCVLYKDSIPIGGWRALRTTEDYLSRKVFPELAPLRTYPSRPDIWDISRLGFLHHIGGPESARLIYGLMCHFAFTREVSSLIGVVDARHARKMAIAGLKIRTFYEPVEVGIDSTGLPIHAFLAELRPVEQRGARFDKIMNLLQSLEIRDEASLLGPESISA